MVKVTESKASTAKKAVVAETPRKKVETKPKPKQKPIKATKSDDEQKEAKHSEKEFYKPGQKFTMPEEGDSTRVFYESLLEEKPDSVMAEKWLMENGCLTDVRQLQAYKKHKGK